MTTDTRTAGRGTAAILAERALELVVSIEDLSTTQLQLEGGTSFTRVTTTVELHGAGHVGRGENVSYDAGTQAKVPGHLAALLARGDAFYGTWSLREFSEHLDELDLEPPKDPAGGMDDKPGYHRWALESAALDLALRQAGTNLAQVAGTAWAPLTTSVSMGLGSPPRAEVIERWLDATPGLTFKVDVNGEWTARLAERLAATGAIRAVDFKALYSGDWLDNDYAPELYGAIADALPDAWLEDAALDAAVVAALGESGCARLAWDYPITTAGDVPGLPSSTARFSDMRPGAINIKPSRFGSLERVLVTIALCDELGIPCYAGGQYELGIGRTHVQSIAALCFPDAPNDCAPVDWHGAAPGDEVPTGPLVVPEDAGFGWDTTGSNPRISPVDTV